jgi:hypothetical protein
MVELTFDPTGAVVGGWDDVVKGELEVDEDVDTPVFPTVDSGRRRATIPLAPLRSNWSVVTTSRYAHAGTAVAVLIWFGYLSPAIHSCHDTEATGNPPGF